MDNPSRNFWHVYSASWTYSKIGTQSCENVKIEWYSVSLRILVVVHASKCTDDKCARSNHDMQKLQKSQARCSRNIYTLTPDTISKHTYWLAVWTANIFAAQRILHWKHSKSANTSRRPVSRDMFKMMAIEIYNSYSCFSVLTRH